MSPEHHLQIAIGRLHFDLAAAQSERDKAIEELKQLQELISGGKPDGTPPAKKLQ